MDIIDASVAMNTLKHNSMRNANSIVFVATQLVDLVVNMVIHFNKSVLQAKVYIKNLILILLLLFAITLLCKIKLGDGEKRRRREVAGRRQEGGEGKVKEDKVEEENLRRVNKVFRGQE